MEPALEYLGVSPRLEVVLARPGVEHLQNMPPVLLGAHVRPSLEISYLVGAYVRLGLEHVLHLLLLGAYVKSPRLEMLLLVGSHVTKPGVEHPQIS